MGVIGSAPIIERVAVVLRQYLQTELTKIDTAANAVAATGDSSFTTETMADCEIQTFVDRLSGSKHRMTIREDGRREASLQVQDIEGANATLPRLDRWHDFIIEIIVTDRGNWTPDGAWLRCDRITNAAIMVLNKYPKLSVSAKSLAVLVKGLDLQSDSAGGETQEEDHIRVTRELRYQVRQIEAR